MGFPVDPPGTAWATTGRGREDATHRDGAATVETERNVCGRDRTLRFALGTALALLALCGRRTRAEPGGDGTVARWQILAMYASAELLVTALVQWCPMNYALGIDSCEHGWRVAIRRLLH